MLTADEMRKQAKDRVFKHRESMLSKGYKSTTIFIKLDILAEMDRLRDLEGLTRHESLDRFFQAYVDSQKAPAPDLDFDDTLKEMDETLAPFDAENKFDGIIEPEPVEQAPFHLGDYSGVTLDTASKDQLLINLADRVPGPQNAQVRVDMLNNAGVTCGRAGAPWTIKKLADNLYLARKRQGRK